VLLEQPVQIYIIIYICIGSHSAQSISNGGLGRGWSLSLFSREKGGWGASTAKPVPSLIDCPFPTHSNIYSSDGAKSVTEVGGAEAVETPKHIR